MEKSYVGQDIPVLEVLRFDMRNAIFVSGNADMIFDRDNLIYSVADLQYALGGMEYATLVRDVEEVLQFEGGSLPVLEIPEAGSGFNPWAVKLSSVDLSRVRKVIPYRINNREGLSVYSRRDTSASAKMSMVLPFESIVIAHARKREKVADGFIWLLVDQGTLLELVYDLYIYSVDTAIALFSYI